VGWSVRGASIDGDVIAVGGEQDADGGAVAVFWPPQEVVDDIDVEVQLPYVSGCAATAFSSKMINLRSPRW
jgi:hypothetical protein